MNLYEKIMILAPNLDENAVTGVIDKVKERIIKNKGEILKLENWGSRKLAYQLNKQDKGIYILLLFKAPPSTVLELERFAKVSDAINKIMVVKITKKKQIEVVMAAIAAAEEKEPAAAQTIPSAESAASQEGAKGV